MMFSSHIDMIYNNSALQDIFVKLRFIEDRLLKRIPLKATSWTVWLTISVVVAENWTEEPEKKTWY